MRAHVTQRIKRDGIVRAAPNTLLGQHCRRHCVKSAVIREDKRAVMKDHVNAHVPTSGKGLFNIGAFVFFCRIATVNVAKIRNNDTTERPACAHKLHPCKQHNHRRGEPREVVMVPQTAVNV